MCDKELVLPGYVSDGDHVFIGARVCKGRINKITITRGEGRSAVVAEFCDGRLLIGGITNDMLTVGCIAISRAAFENIKRVNT